MSSATPVFSPHPWLVRAAPLQASMPLGIQDALKHHFEAREEHVNASKLAYNMDPSVITFERYQRAITCNFATIIVLSETGTMLHIPFVSPSEGGRGDSENHGERKAWKETQEWYRGLAEQPQIGSIIIISDRHPCLNRDFYCLEYFKTTATDAHNSMPFSLERDRFIYFTVSPSNGALFTILLEANLEYYATAIADLLYKKLKNYCDDLREIEGNRGEQIKYLSGLTDAKKAEEMKHFLEREPEYYPYLCQEANSMPPQHPGFYLQVYQRISAAVEHEQSKIRTTV